MQNYGNSTRNFFFCPRLRGAGLQPSPALTHSRQAPSSGGWPLLSTGRKAQEFREKGGKIYLEAGE